jgi:hypothetical protein
MHLMDLAEQQRFRPAPLAMTAITSEGVILLDLHTDQFLGLNKTATTMWELLCAGKTVEEVLHFLERTYAAEPGRLRDDLTQFVATMQERRLLEPGDQFPALPAASTSLLHPPCGRKIFHLLPDSRLCAVLEAHLVLRWVDRTLQRSGFHALAASLAALPAQRIVTREEHMVQSLISAVSLAAAWQPFKALCLHECLALCYMLRCRHIKADLVVGAYTHPFSAHAWVECAGQIIFWQAGLGSAVGIERVQAMQVLFHSARPLVQKGSKP